MKTHIYLTILLISYIICGIACYKEIGTERNKCKAILMSVFWPILLFIYAIASIFNL